MRIRKLEIQGFKSFADRVNLAFGNGITGVVGPNGCGKSNVVDALRWVMGEQSAKHLRGGNMTDVIFNGSQARGPQGMAEVTVTFENDGHLVPPEYAHLTEISVTRRLYRDGESDYEINRTPCRLRDINELFLGTGIGKRGFSIIEQGQVATIIRSKAEDRRRIIEEAAGITKYKARRQTAERKMAATEQNLLRITDVIREVQRRLGSLKRQAKKAERYKELRAEARDVELHEAALRFFELHGLIAFDATHHNRAEEDVVSLEARVTSLDAQTEIARIGLLDEDRALQEAQARQYELDNEIALKEQEKVHSRQALEQGDLRDREGRDEIAGLKEALALVATQRADLERGAESLIGEAEQHQLALEEAQQALLDLTQRRSHEARDLDELRRKVVGAASRAAQLEAQLEGIRHREEELDGRMAARSEELALATGELEEGKARIQSFEAALEEALTEASVRGEEQAALSEQLETQRQALKVLDQRILEERERLTERKSRLGSLEEIHRRFEWSPAGVRALLDQAHADPDVKGLFADLFEVPQDLEVAVSSALGERLQTVVVSTKEAAVRGIVRLLDEEKGKAWMLVDGHTAPRRVAPLPGTSSILDHLQIPAEHRRVVEALLGAVLLVDEGTDPVTLWDAAAAQGATLLSRQGSVLSPEGLLHGGSLDGEETGLLRQKREIRELEEQVQGLEAALEATLEERAQQGDEATRLEQRLDEVTRRLREIELTQLDRTQALNRQKDDVTRAERRTADLQAELDRERKAKELLLSDAQHARGRLDESVAERDAAERTLADAALAAESLEAALAERSERVTQLKVQAAAAQERRENLRQSLEHHQKNQADIEGRLLRLSEQHDNWQRDRERLIQTEVEAGERIQQLLSDRATLAETLESRRANYEATMEKVRGLEMELREARGGLDKLRRSAGEIGLRLREHHLELKALTDRTLSAHSVRPEEVLFDYHLLPAPGRDAKERLAELRKQMEALGEINLTAIDEYAELEDRYTFLKTQSDDLTHALEQLEKAIVKINRTTKKRFKEAFDQINTQFEKVFPRLFRGGKAWLALTDPNDLLATGVEIYAQPPGKKLGSVALMSGGEQALTAVSLIFAIFLIKPSPFCLLDEVDAPLDESNVSRFNDLIKDVSNISQFIVITHNKKTMECADQLYGITMEQPGISKAVNVRMS